MLSIRADIDLKPLHRALLDFGNKQVTFGAAIALTNLAKGVSAVESDQVKSSFDSPTPFTQNGFRIVPATKGTLASFVMVKDIQAQYLAPYVFGGPRFLGSKQAMLVPKQQALNQYGNIPRNTLKRLSGRKDIFIGPVRFKNGQTVNGVWQRPIVGTGRDGTRGLKNRKGDKQASAMVGASTRLVLLIRFEDTTEVPKHLPFFERAEAYVRANARREFEAGMRQALASAR